MKLFPHLRLAFLTVFASIAVVACTPTGGIASNPGELAGQTVLDEKAAIGIETAYTAAAKAAAVAIETGAINDPATITKIGAADRRAYMAVVALRSAYDAGNATSYSEAFIEANGAVRIMLTAISGD